MNVRPLILPVLLVSLLNGATAFAQHGPRITFLKDETLRETRTFTFVIQSTQAHVDLYLFAQFFGITGKGDKGAPRSGYFEVDGQRLYSWRNEPQTKVDLTLSPGEHTVTLSLTEPAWLAEFSAELLKGQAVTQFFEVPTKKGALGLIKQRIKALSLDEKRELLRWLAVEVGEPPKG